MQNINKRKKWKSIKKEVQRKERSKH
jgi:hypothetical protein